MIDFPIKIFLSMYDKAVESAVKETSLPDTVHAEFLPTPENKNAVPDNVTAVFITDKISQLRLAVSFRKKNLKIVYCGFTADADKYLNKLSALWPAGESAEIVKKRFTILIRNLKHEFDAWFYQNTLLTTISSFPVPMGIFSSDWKAVRMNHLFEEISGISSGHAENFNYQEWKKQHLIPVNTGTADPKSYSHVQEYEIEHGGETKYFIIREQEIRDFFNHISGYFLIMQDITYQRVYERSIIETASADKFHIK